MNLRKISREPMRPDDERAETEDKEIWQPKWRCFCCADTGIISAHLASMVIDGYSHQNDKLPRCTAPKCRADCYFETEQLEDCLDRRVDAETCQQLDALERQAWRETVKSQQAFKVAQVSELAQSMQMPGSGKRSQLDEEMRQRKIDEAAAITSEEWQKMSSDYLSSD